MANEYNRIHSLAWARKLVMQKFGANLLNFWPMADSNPFIRDLLSHTPLSGSEVVLQQPGMLDYAVDVQQGYVASGLPDKGDSGQTPSQYCVLLTGIQAAAVIPSVAWTASSSRTSTT